MPEADPGADLEPDAPDVPLETSAAAPGEETCEEAVAEFVPSTLWLAKQDSWDYPFRLSTGVNKWSDGTEMRGSEQYRQGDNEGENGRYFYPEFWTSRDILVSPGMAYGKGPVMDDDGTILGKHHFRVDMVLEPIEGSERQEDGVQLQLFKVVEHDVHQCVSPPQGDRAGILDPRVNG